MNKQIEVLYQLQNDSEEYMQETDPKINKARVEALEAIVKEKDEKKIEELIGHAMETAEASGFENGFKAASKLWASIN